MKMQKKPVSQGVQKGKLKPQPNVSPESVAVTRPKLFKANHMAFDAFFSYMIRKYPKQVRIDHYKPLKSFLISKNHGMIDTKEGFTSIFKEYGLNL